MEDQLQHFLTAQKKKKTKRKTAQSPVAPVKTEVTAKDEIANSGHRKPRAQEAQHLRLSTMTKSNSDTKTAHTDTRSQQLDRYRPARKRRSAFLVSRRRNVAVSKTRMATIGIFRYALFTTMGNADQVRIVPSSTLAKDDMSEKDKWASDMTAKHAAGGKSLQVLHMEKLHAQGNFSFHKATGLP